MKTRLNPLESRAHNSSTPEEVRREVVIIKHCRRLFDESAVSIRGSCPERRDSRGGADTIRPASAVVRWGWLPAARGGGGAKRKDINHSGLTLFAGLLLLLLRSLLCFRRLLSLFQ